MIKKIIYFFTALFFLNSSTEAQFITNRDASIITPQCNANVTTYQLTPNLPNQSGQIWNVTPINLTQAFDVQFEIFPGTKSYGVGADGMCFVLQQLPNNAGDSGGGLGYEGMLTSLAVEFDTYQNGWDPAYCHTAIEKNGDIDHTDLSGNNLAGPVQLSPTNPNLPDGAWHNIEITWNPNKDTISVYFDCVFRVGYRGNIIDSIFKGNPNVYWGFTGGTGADDNSQQVCITNSYSLSSSAVNPSCNGRDGKAIAVINGGATPFTYLWTPSNQTTDTATGLSAGLYTVTIHSPNDTCVTLRDTIRLSGPSVYMRFTNAQCARLNTGTATIYITNGQAPYTYTWSNGGTNQKDTGLVVGKYYVTVVDSLGCTLKDSVTIGTDPPPNISTVPPGHDSICYDGSAVITATGGKTYSWLPNRGLSCYNCASPTATPSVTTTYTITGIDSNGCSNTATIVVKVIPLPKPIVTGPDSICIGSSATLNVTGASTYLWNPGAGTGTSYTVRPAATTTYTVKATSGNCSSDTTFKVTVVPVPLVKIKASKDSVCTGDSLTLSASGATSYRWSPGNSTSKTIHINLANTKTYTLYGYGGACVDSASITLKVIQPVSVTVSSDLDSICPGQSAVLTAKAQGGQATYKWSDGETTSSITVKDSVTKTYTITVYGVCDSMKEPITVNVVPLPKPVIVGPRTRCMGAKDTLTISSSVNPTTYVWSNGQTGTSFTTTGITSNTTITVQAFNSLGCSVIDTFNIKVIPYPTATITYSPGCGSDVTPITATAQGMGNITYLWNTGGTNDTIDVYVNADTTVYSVVISNGCPITKKVTVIKDVPALSACCSTTIFGGASTPINAGGANIVRYQWLPDTALNCDTCATVIANPTVTTTYTVIGTDAAGCKSERIVTITVEVPCFTLTIPNVFTPGNAGTLGMDNVFYIETKNINAWSLVIYDRWGKEVFKSSNPTQYWDGKTESGAQATAGVYYYVINGTCQNTTYKKDGFVQLIR